MAFCEHAAFRPFSSHVIEPERPFKRTGFASLLALLLSIGGGAKVRARLKALDVRYLPWDPFEEDPEPFEEVRVDDVPLPRDGEHGTASLPAALAASPTGVLVHHLRSRDGFHATSRWEVS